MRVFMILAVLLLAGAQCLAWDNAACYKGAVPGMVFPKESRSTITLEARRVVSVQGNIVIYDLGAEKIVIKCEGVSCQSFLKEVQQGRCVAKGFVVIEPDKGGFSDTGRFKAQSPGPH